MPSVAKGARRQAWNASRASGMRCLPGKAADGREKILGDAHALAQGALAIRAAPLAGKAHTLLLRHGGDECLDTFEVRIEAGECRGIDGDERLADARRLSFLDEE